MQSVAPEPKVIESPDEEVRLENFESEIHDILAKMNKQTK
jgi:hypothetical protein